ncbi:MAG: hypothetical protein KDJ96_14245 [Rhodobacteraceae bacterium]|nr:hypothetical protein [Paracoccaceae bacterium]
MAWRMFQDLPKVIGNRGFCALILRQSVHERPVPSDNCRANRLIRYAQGGEFGRRARRVAGARQGRSPDLTRVGVALLPDPIQRQPRVALSERGLRKKPPGVFRGVVADQLGDRRFQPKFKQTP